LSPASPTTSAAHWPEWSGRRFPLPARCTPHDEPHAEAAAVRRRVPRRPERHAGRHPGRVQRENGRTAGAALVGECWSGRRDARSGYPLDARPRAANARNAPQTEARLMSVSWLWRRAWLRALLGNGPVDSRTLFAAAREEGFAPRSLRRSAHELEVEMRRE